MIDSQIQPDAIGVRLRWAREQSGLSQGQVARMMQYHRPTISQIEAGQRQLRPDEIVHFAKLYDVKESWIVSGDSALDEVLDPKIEIAARELSKLRPEDLTTILTLIRVMRSRSGESIE